MKTWYEAYRLIAELLNEFYMSSGIASIANRQMLAKLYNPEYLDKNKWLIQAKEKHKATGVDPIQIFASFNNQGAKSDTRIENINILLEILGSNKKAVYVKDFFDGCPSPIITKIINSRADFYQEQIWTIFNNVISYGKEGLLREHFDAINNWYGIDIASFTMFLFWIDSDNFLPLDKNTSAFLVVCGIIEKSPRNYEEYLRLCNIEVFRGYYREVVNEAYEFINNGETVVSYKMVKLINKFNEEQKSVDKDLNERKHSYQQNFKIIAIRPTNEKQKHLKNLHNGVLYLFYNSYKFNEDDSIIEFNEGVKDTLYNKKNLKISISAIVGKNGSGKSAITELLFLAINKLSLYKISEPEEDLIDEEVYLDLFFKSDSLYKITFGKEIVIQKYVFSKEEHLYKNPIIIEKEKFNLDSFFYSIIINYSLYGLNSRIIGKWINPLFHKNDSYQIPIVLNPKRDEGIIDVNNEEDLAKSRLLSNILEPDRIDFDNEIIPEIVPGAVPIRLEFSFDIEKFERKRTDYKLQYKEEVKKENINKIIELLNINNKSEVAFADECKEYIYLKLVSIANYPKFDEFKHIPRWLYKNDVKLKKYIDMIVNEKSHITFKLRQAINYLKFEVFNYNGNISIFNISSKIKDIKAKEFEKGTDLKTIELVPPSFLKTNIIFNHGGSFKDLSSGEKQQIFSINTFAYHLYNINSVMQYENVIKYSNVNLIFDEVELYFHPEMQRTLIKDLRERIISLNLDYINNINILFITHSPFILSDIPSSNILFLNDNGLPNKSAINSKTFGANIHELLAHSFFLENTLGEFAKNKINEILEFHYKVRNFNSKNINDLRVEYKLKQVQFKDIVNNIGEDIIRGVIKNHIDFIEDILIDK